MAFTTKVCLAWKSIFSSLNQRNKIFGYILKSRALIDKREIANANCYAETGRKNVTSDPSTTKRELQIIIFFDLHSFSIGCISKFHGDKEGHC